MTSVAPPGEPAREPRHAAEVVLAVAAVAVAIAAVEVAAEYSDWMAREGGALVAAAFLGVPLLVARQRPFEGDPLGLPGPQPWRALGLGMAVSAVVLVLFAAGFDGWQTTVHGLARGAGPGLWTAPPELAQWGPGWLAWLALTQFVVVAVPEEAFFRGYVLARLRGCWPPQTRILGVPFGAAHVASAALFAVIHLVATPAPHRLLVFFPGLVFAWLAQRSGGALAPAIHHALANVAMQALHRLYG
ncbi:MAG: CPBP family intramembrane metalloprotease [Myxococcales bacterium]|nr:CPBP family intramembrane metalloprotease [Myxococcales bacterium]